MTNKASKTEPLSEMHVAELVHEKNAKIGRELLLLTLATAITIGASFSLGGLPALGYPLMIVGFTCMGWLARGVHNAQQIDTRFYPNDTMTHSVTIGATKDGMSRKA